MNRIEIRPEIKRTNQQWRPSHITYFVKRLWKWVTSKNTNKRRKKAKEREQITYDRRDNTEYFTVIKRIVKEHFIDFDLHLIKNIINLKLF